MTLQGTLSPLYDVNWYCTAFQVITFVEDSVSISLRGDWPTPYFAPTGSAVGTVHLEAFSVNDLSAV